MATQSIGLLTSYRGTKKTPTITNTISDRNSNSSIIFTLPLAGGSDAVAAGEGRVLFK